MIGTAQYQTDHIKSLWCSIKEDIRELYYLLYSSVMLQMFIINMDYTYNLRLLKTFIQENFQTETQKT